MNWTGPAGEFNLADLVAMVDTQQGVQHQQLAVSIKLKEPAQAQWAYRGTFY